MPFIVPPLMKWVLAAVGGAAVVHWAVREIRRVNDEIERVRASSSTDAAARHELPTLKRDPSSGEWRVG